jgi:hypothetical protein
MAQEVPYGLTVAQARVCFHGLLQVGVLCPVCDRVASVSTVRLLPDTVRSLLRLNRLTDPAPATHCAYVGELLDGRDYGRDLFAYSSMKYWGLAESVQAEEGQLAGQPGYWRVTKHGRKYVRRKVRLPPVARVYRDEVLEFRGDMLYVDELLARRHVSYAQMLAEEGY